ELARAAGLQQRPVVGRREEGRVDGEGTAADRQATRADSAGVDRERTGLRDAAALRERAGDRAAGRDNHSRGGESPAGHVVKAAPRVDTNTNNLREQSGAAGLRERTGFRIGSTEPNQQLPCRERPVAQTILCAGDAADVEVGAPARYRVHAAALIP